MWFKAGKWKITNINIVFVVCAFHSNHREFPNANDNGIGARAHRHHISMYLHIIASMHAYHYHEPNEQRIKRWTFYFLFKSHFKKKETRQEKDTHTIFYQMSHAHWHSKLHYEPSRPNEWLIPIWLYDSKWNMNLIYFDIRPLFFALLPRLPQNHSANGSEHTINDMKLALVFLKIGFNKSIAKLFACIGIELNTCPICAIKVNSSVFNVHQLLWHVCVSTRASLSINMLLTAAATTATASVSIGQVEGCCCLVMTLTNLNAQHSPNGPSTQPPFFLIPPSISLAALHSRNETYSIHLEMAIFRMLQQLTGPVLLQKNRLKHNIQQFTTKNRKTIAYVSGSVQRKKRLEIVHGTK